MRLRWGVILFTLFGVSAIFFGLTVLCYGVAAGVEWGLEWLFGYTGGAAIGNILSLMLLAVMVLATVLTLAERKWSAMMQDRVGPNRANIGPIRIAGAPHMAADAVKMLFKEDFIPEGAAPFLFGLAPIIAFAPVFCLFAIIPVAPPIEWPWLFHKTVELKVASPDFGLLYIFGVASLAVYGTSLAGWASNNKLALLGGVRASSQMISYEVALGLSLVGAMMAYSTVKLDTMIFGQSQYLWGDASFGIPAWGILLQPVGFILFFAAAFAETKRAPFDMPEGESEIIGYFVEYSGMRFGLFMIAEFVEVVVLSAVIVAIFLGGYNFGFFGVDQFVRNRFGEVGFGFFAGMVFWWKVLILCWLQLAIRWTFPRFRYDQIQTLGWRMLLPIGLVNVFVTGALILWDPSLHALAILGMLEIAALVAMVFWKREPVAEGAHGHGHDAHGHGHDAHAAPAAAHAAGH